MANPIDLTLLTPVPVRIAQVTPVEVHPSLISWLTVQANAA